MHQAAQIYQSTQQKTLTPRQLEAKLLLKAAGRLEAAKKDPAAQAEALAYNRKLWTLFVSAVTAEDSPLPNAVRENVANLGLFVFKQTLTAQRAKNETAVSPLISINREVAAGLRDMAVGEV